MAKVTAAPSHLSWWPWLSSTFLLLNNTDVHKKVQVYIRLDNAPFNNNISIEIWVFCPCKNPKYNLIYSSNNGSLINSLCIVLF